jgi:hypothetical protein
MYYASHVLKFKNKLENPLTLVNKTKNTLIFRKEHTFSKEAKSFISIKREKQQKSISLSIKNTTNMIKTLKIYKQAKDIVEHRNNCKLA